MMNKGKLYVVSTPIGNLGDMTYRAVEILNSVAFILAEDTRVSKKLLNHYKVNTQLVSYRDQNHDQMIEKVFQKLDMGLDLALVSDNGTPLISDPGYKLVRDLGDRGYEVLPVPGASAGIAAMSVSGIPTDNFKFLGFLPKSQKKRLEILKANLNENLIIYESPKRVKKFLSLIINEFDQREIFVAREMTKKFEEYLRINDLEDIENLNDKGEFVLVVRVSNL